jgi:phosphinothricin acetyltransferase
VLCGRTFAPAILAIINDAILNTTAIWDYRPRPAASMDAWFEHKERHDFPVVGLVDGDDLLGFATYGTFRAWPAYKYAVEHSIYVDARHRRHGFGGVLLEALLQVAEEQGYRTVIGGSAADNVASIRLHERLGFVTCGTIKHAGYKFDRWLDLIFMQYLLPTPAKPVAE